MASSPTSPTEHSDATAGGIAAAIAAAGALAGALRLDSGGAPLQSTSLLAGASNAPPSSEDVDLEGFDTKPDLHAIQSQMQMREAKPYKCTQCIKSFANSSYLSQHMRIHLGIKPFGPCQYCGKKFTQLSHLQQHIRTHTGEKPYKCKYAGCEKAFSQLSNLQSHSRCHQSDKPFKCNSCYKCFTDEQSLLEHIPKHKESKHLKVHICPFCGKSYTQATYLSKHMTKHADRTRGAIRHDFGALGSGGGGGAGGSGGEVQPPALDLHSWNPAAAAAQLPVSMADEAAQAQQLAFSQFNAGMMQAAAVSSQSAAAVAAYPPSAALNNSAFSQLLNFQRNPRYNPLDYQPFKAPNDRPAGDVFRPCAESSSRIDFFNMITPLENIQRYTQQGAAAAAAASAAAAGAASAASAGGGGGHPQFPSNIISPMKPAY